MTRSGDGGAKFTTLSIDNPNDQDPQSDYHSDSSTDSTSSRTSTEVSLIEIPELKELCNRGCQIPPCKQPSRLSSACDTVRSLASPLSPRHKYRMNKKYRRVMVKSYSSTMSPTAYNAQITTHNVLIPVYDHKLRRSSIYVHCCASLSKLICAAWCMLIVWLTFISVVFIGYWLYRHFIVSGKYQFDPAIVIGVFTLVLLCSFACCALCTWLAVDNLLMIIKHKELQHISNFCDYVCGKDRDKYYSNQWHEVLLECNKVDYFVNFYGRKYACCLDKDTLQLIYDYNGKDYVDRKDTH